MPPPATWTFIFTQRVDLLRDFEAGSVQACFKLQIFEEDEEKDEFWMQRNDVRLVMKAMVFDVEMHIVDAGFVKRVETCLDLTYIESMTS